MNTSRLLAAIPLFLTMFLFGCDKGHHAIQTLEDATHARIGVMTGTTGEAIAKAWFPQGEIKSFHDVMDAVGAIKAGRLDGIVTSSPTAIQVSKKNPELGWLAEPLSNEQSSVALRKGNPQLLAAVNQIISKLRNNGTLESMKKRWFKQDLSPYEERDIVLPAEGPVLRIGVSATREPFSFVDDNGRVTGHDGELARIIASKLHRPIEFSNMKFMALIPALQSGKVDMIVSGMTATEERKQFVDFSEPYFESSQVMLVRKAVDAPGKQISSHAETAGSLNMSSVADITNKKIGVLVGSAHDTYAIKTFPNATILHYRTAPDIALGVKTGKVDVALYDEVPLQEMLRQDPALGILGESLFSFPVGVGFNKSSGDLRDSFNRFLVKIKKDGVYAGMVDRWIQKRESRMPEISGSRSNGVLTTGVTSAGGAPFTFIQDNQLLGFDIELVKRFGAFIGKEVKFADMEFGGLIAAVSSKKVDMIAASIYITEERKKQIDFSDPYYEMGNRVFALKSNIAAYATQVVQPASESYFTSIANSFRSNLIDEKRYLLIWDGLKTTVILSVLSTILGTVLGALVCFMRMSRVRLLSGLAKAYISVVRGTPVLVLLMLIFYVVFASVNINSVLVAVIAFGMNFAAYVSEIFRIGIEGVDKGQTEAGIAMGFSRLQTFVHVVLPQTVRRILPGYKGEFISLVKMTSIVGYVAVQDLTKASDIVRSRTFDAFFPLVMVAILYFAISWILLQSLGHVERITDPKYGRAKAELA